MNVKLRARTLAVTTLTDAQKREFFTLFEGYYSDVSYEAFCTDLRDKDQVLVLDTTHGGRLVGFTTIFCKRLPQVGPGTFLFSGDTVVDREYWGSKILQKAFTDYLVRLRLTRPFEPIYWMLISKGFKTYIMMKKSIAVSFPRRECATPKDLRLVMDRFYSYRFAGSYRPEMGLLQFGESRGSVKGDIAVPSEMDLKDPDIRFFMERNPGFHRGDELTCVAQLTFNGLASLAFKRFSYKKGRRGQKIAPARTLVTPTYE